MVFTRRGLVFFLLIDTVLIAAGITAFLSRRTAPPAVGLESFNQATMRIESPAFAQNALIPKTYACDGDDVSPPLAVSGVPASAKTLALIVDDPDAPFGTWVHWTAWNIPVDTSVIAEGSVPRGAVEGSTSAGKPGYGGPCPPSGTHRYFFKLYALDTALSLPSSADAKALEAAMEGHVLDKAGLVGRYAR